MRCGACARRTLSATLVDRASLLELNTLHLAASARALRAPENPDALRATLNEAAAGNLPVVVLGEGSNVVLMGDLDALVLRYLGKGRHVMGDDGRHVRLRVAGGESWHALTSWTLEQGYYGLENLALIPGTVGAAPIQNIGAYGVELSQFVDRVQFMDIDTRQLHELTAHECQFGYRDSVFKHRLRDRCVITAVDMTLRRSDRPDTHYTALSDYLAARGRDITAVEVHRAVVALRSARLPDPSREPNAGSFFKNPIVSTQQAQVLQHDNPGMPLFKSPEGAVKIPAGWLIEACGWKGYSEGGVGVHPGHALVLVNQGCNAGAAVIDLAARIQASVRQRFGCDLDIEPRIYGVAE